MQQVREGVSLFGFVVRLGLSVIVALWLGCGIALTPPAAPPSPRNFQAESAQLSASGPVVEPADAWTHWRGPLQRGESPELDLPDTWSPEGENLLWTQPYGGRSCPLVMNGRVYIIGAGGEGITTHERVVCFDAETGEKLWEYPFNVFHTDIVANRVGWANLAGDPETGYVYAHGVQDMLLCLDVEGDLVWSRSLGEEFAAVTGYGGRVHTPIVDEDRVIISFLNSTWGEHARPLHRYLALDKRTGEVLWWAAPGEAPLDTTYSTPVVAVIDGRRLLIAGNADGSIYAMKARTGEPVWRFRLSQRGINGSVVVDGNRVYACHGEENLDQPTMGRVVCIDARGQGDITETHEIWRRDAIEVGYSSPAFHDGKLYVTDNSANLYCLDTESGRVLWEHSLGTIGRGSTPVWADGKIYVTEYQSFHILRPRRDGCESLDVKKFASPQGPVEVWGSPAVANGRVYFTTMDALYALGYADWSRRQSPLPPTPPEAPANADTEPAWIQIVPAEVLLSPGQEVTFEVRAYDDAGRFLRNVPAAFSLEELKGEWTASGAFRAATASRGQAGHVQAQFGDQTTRARVRILPELPFREDFSSCEPGRVPAHWVTTAAKFVATDHDGERVLQKTNTNPAPPVARSIAFIGPPEWANYTIEADCMGTEVRFNLPDMGLVNSRYSLALIGNDQQLAIMSWDALPRLVESVDFPIEPQTWYRMKLRVDIQNGKGLIRGKVWDRDEPEPAGWTVEAHDPMPNRNGSPGLYAYSTAILADAPGTAVYFDNVQVQPTTE